ARREPHAPRQPRGTGAEAIIPAATRVELADQVEEPRGGGVEVRGQLGDLVAQSVQFPDWLTWGAKGGVHRRFSFALRRIYTPVSEPSGRRDKRRLRQDPHFLRRSTQGDVSGLLGTAGWEFTRHCRHAATARAGAVKRYFP